MTITLRHIENTEDLDARWPEIWPLLDALDSDHAEFLNKELRPRREERNYKSFLAGLKNGGHWLLIAEQDREIVAVCSSNIKAKDRTYPGPIADAGALYIKEAFRGEGLGKRMRQLRDENLLQNGVTMKESAVSAHNAQAQERFKGRNRWGATLRRPLRAPESLPRVAIRRVKNLDPEWAGIWRLLQASEQDTEADKKESVEACLAKRGAVFVAGEEPVGVIIGRIHVDPWLFVERVGVVTDLVVDKGEDKEVAEALLGRLEQWMASKQATDIETPPIRLGEYQAWTDRGFEPYLLWSRSEIQKPTGQPATD